MTIVDFIILALIAAIAGAIGQSLAGYYLGGCVVSAVVGYIGALGAVPEFARLFAYHGAEHRAIHAWEHNRPLTREEVRAFPNAHARCGTAFLLTVMVVTIVVYSFIGRPALPVLILSRVVLIPLIAGLSYEIIRYAARHMDKGWVRVLMRPGLLLQRLTTRQPTLDQVEVAVTSLRAVLTAEKAG